MVGIWSQGFPFWNSSRQNYTEDKSPPLHPRKPSHCIFVNRLRRCAASLFCHTAFHQCPFSLTFKASGISEIQGSAEGEDKVSFNGDGPQLQGHLRDVPKDLCAKVFDDVTSVFTSTVLLCHFTSFLNFKIINNILVFGNK